MQGKPMFSIDDVSIEQKIQSIHATKAGFRQAKDRRNAFERVLRDYHERLWEPGVTESSDVTRDSDCSAIISYRSSPHLSNC